MSSSVTDLALLGRLFEEHRPRLLAMVERRMDPALRARVGPEDVLNDAFLQARSRWQRFREEGRMRPYPWLYRIVLDRLIEAWRRETRECRDLHADMPWPEESSIQLGLRLVDAGTSPTAAAARDELRRQVRQVLELLSEKDREILRMRHEDDLTHAEAAEVLGITENAATVRYVRALRRLRDLWKRLHPGSELIP